MSSTHALNIREVGNGPPLVLLHAFPLSSEMWLPQSSALSSSWHLLLPDSPGFGASPNANGWTVDSHADELADALDAHGVTEPIVLGGLSMGGYVALAFARRHPDRLRGLILADTKAEADTDEAKANRDRMMAFAQDRGVAAVIDSMLPKMVSETTTKTRPEIVAEIRRIASAQSVAGIVAALQALRDRPDATPHLGRITVPTQIIVGSDDALTPPSAAHALAAAIPNATVAEIPQSGHLSNLEASDKFNAILRTFLANLK